MSVSRYLDRFREEYKGRATRMVRSMLSAVAIAAYEAGERIAYRGREAADGSADEDLAEHYGVIGLVSRPPKGRGRAILAHVGAEAGHAVIIATKDDDTRTAIINTVGLDWDEVIVHNSLLIMKFTSEGKVLIGMPDGTFKAVATEDHTHALPLLAGQATYTENEDPTARTGPPDKVSKDIKVT